MMFLKILFLLRFIGCFRKIIILLFINLNNSYLNDLKF